MSRRDRPLCGHVAGWPARAGRLRTGVFDGGDFSGAKFSSGTVSFAGAEFPGGTVDFSRVASWTQPPDFGSGFDTSHPPTGVMPPTATSPSPAKLAPYREKKLVTGSRSPTGRP